MSATLVDGVNGHNWLFKLGYAAKDKGKPWHHPPGGVPVLKWGITDEARRCPAVLTAGFCATSVCRAAQPRTRGWSP